MSPIRRTAGCRTGNGGFTTREWIFLAALGCMLVLAVIPFFKSEEKQASRVVAMNNLMQWGIGLNLYLIENDNRLPQVGPQEADATLADAWYNALPPYLSQAPWPQVARTGLHEADNTSIIWRDPVMMRKFGSVKGVFVFPYAMNRWLQPDITQPASQIFDLASPSAVIFLGESASTDPGLVPEAVSYRHSRKPNAPGALTHLLFADGHAAMAERRDVMANPDGSAPMPDSGVPPITWHPFPGAPAPK